MAMAHHLKTYTDLAAASPRTRVHRILGEISNAQPFAYDEATRKELIGLILADLQNLGQPNRLIMKGQALSALKALGKDPAGSQTLALPENLSALLSLFSKIKDDQNDFEDALQALRCIANALLLVDEARTVFVGKEVNGGEICISFLEKAVSPDLIFILSRILFLCTVSCSSYLGSLVEEKHSGRGITDIIGAKLDCLTVAILAGTKLAKEAMADLLKFAFNLLLHYPKMVQHERYVPETASDTDKKLIGDYWSPKLDGLLPPLIRVFVSLPPAFPNPIASPLSHTVHSLITIPINQSLRPIWFGKESSPPASLTGSPKGSLSLAPQDYTPPDAVSESPSPRGSPKPSTIDRAISVLTRRSCSRSSSPNTIRIDILQRAWDLLDVSFSHFFPGTIEVDDPGIREAVKRESVDNTLDDILSPLIVLITRLCVADETSRKRARQWLVPDDLDRSSPLEGRADLLGRCLRVLGSIYHTRVKDVTGELLFALADSDANTLCALVGYGNVAGFLFHKGVMSAPPAASNSTSAPLTTPSGAEIDPITGTTGTRKAPLPDMTDDEKEREMEKLFVLFDRLEKNGAIPASQNPMRQVIQRGMSGS